MPWKQQVEIMERQAQTKGFVPFVPDKTPSKPRPPRLLRTTDPRRSVDPRLEQSVRTIELSFDDVYFQGEQVSFF